jgi:hypothetical protein
MFMASRRNNIATSEPSNQALTVHDRLLQPRKVNVEILAEVALSTIKDNTVARRAMIEWCRQFFANNNAYRVVIHEFAQSYEPSSAAYWYIRNTFVFRIVNETLRTGKIEEFYLLRSFIADLSALIIELKRQQRRHIVQAEVTLLYRGLRQSENDLQILRNLVGHIVASTTFMSTSRDKQTALTFACPSTDPQSSETQALLLEIHADLNSPMVLAADVSHLSQFPLEQEIIFDINNTFRIETLIYEPSKNVWHCRFVTITDRSLLDSALPNEACLTLDAD